MILDSDIKLFRTAVRIMKYDFDNNLVTENTISSIKNYIKNNNSSIDIENYKIVGNNYEFVISYLSNNIREKCIISLDTVNPTKCTNC